MTSFFARNFPILFGTRNTTTGLADAIRTIDVGALCREYDQLRREAPRRTTRGKRYFVGHDGRVQAKNPGNPSEKHLAIALWRLKARWPRVGGGRMRLLDYEFPLQASRADAGLGEVDLLGVTDQGRLVVVELKARRKNNSRGDTPLFALMEGLRYAAVVRANQRAIAAEAQERFDIRVSEEPPIVQTLAPEDWWRGWCDMVGSTRKAAGEWEPRFLDLLDELEARLGIVIECASLQGITLADVRWDGCGPHLEQTPAMHRVCLDGAPAPAPAPPPVAAGAGDDATGYENVLLGHLWGWADQYHAGELDGGSRVNRPPVLRAELASKSLLVPSDTTKASGIVSAIASKARHQWFRSFKSSQALTQSVFGALGAFGRLDLLDGVIAECGRPAFLVDTSNASLVLEHEVRSLGEPRPTSVDVFLDARSRRVAVECKLTEREFGVCSWPQLPSDAEQHCDGNYRIQRERSERCALTEIGVRYWTYLPHLFDWAADGDLRPCPFSAVYQLARNALAATVSECGFDPHSGHVLVVYDARNPEFAAGGEAERQYESAVRACRVPGLIRRLSWQRLADAFTCAPELAYLLGGLEGKYGIRPERGTSISVSDERRGMEDSEKLRQGFNRGFAHWNIELPVDAMSPGKVWLIVQRGWTIWTRFDVDAEDGRGHLDFYSTNRMTTDSHARFVRRWRD